MPSSCHMPPSRHLLWGYRLALLVLALAVLSSCAEVSPGIVQLALPTTTGTITGTVINSGTPISGATVATVPGTVTASTDSAGHFTLSNIVPQTLIVTVAPATFLSASAQVTVLPGQTSTVTLTPAQSTSGTINGRVTDGVNPVADAVVTTLPPTQRITSAIDGSFLYAGITPGIYQVNATKPGFFDANATVTITSGLVARVALAVTRRTDGVITGVVTDGVNPIGTTTNVVTISLFAGTRRDILIRPEFVFQPPSDPSFPTPLNFNYTFDGIPGGFATVQAQAAGFATGIKEVRIEPPLTSNGEIILSRDGTTGAVAGTIFDPFGNPRAGVNVQVGPASQAATATTSTDASGRFRFTALAPGVFDVSVHDTLFATGTVRVNVAPAGTADGSIRLPH